MVRKTTTEKSATGAAGQAGAGARSQSGFVSATSATIGGAGPRPRIRAAGTVGVVCVIGTFGDDEMAE